MTTPPRLSSVLALIICVSAIFLAVACDSGGGGGDSKSLEYTGLTTKATITQTNAVDLAVGSAQEGIRGNAFSGIAQATEPPPLSPPPMTNLYQLARIMQETVGALDPQAMDATSPERTVLSEKRTIEGSCGGRAAGEISVDDESGEFWGELSFKEYCVGSVTMDGLAEFSGVIDLASNEIESMHLSLEYLSSSDAYGTYILDGTLSVSLGYPGSILSMDMLIQSGSKEDVFWIDDYRMEIVTAVTTVSLNISGRFYDPAYGYVTVSTPVDIQADAIDMVPNAGELLVVGADGTAGGPTMAKLTCSEDGVYAVTADTDGDGVFEWESGQRFWSDL